MSSAISTPGGSGGDGAGDLEREQEGPGKAVDSALYRSTCAKFATGITVVTVTDDSGLPHGMTVNSFSSVSLDPPLVLVSIDLRNYILAHFTPDSCFAINILAENQEHLSRQFAGPAQLRLGNVAWSRGAGGAPLLDGVVAQLECTIANQFAAGDHTVLIGHVRHARHNEGNPLLYFGSRYRHLS